MADEPTRGLILRLMDQLGAAMTTNPWKPTEDGLIPMAQVRELASDPGAMPGVGGVAMLRDSAGKPMRMFHGTTAAFEDFNPKFSGRHGNLFGPGFYFTDDPTVAAEYALIGSENARGAVSDLATGRATQEMAMRWLRDAIEYEPAIRGANVRPAYLDLERPFDMGALYPTAELVDRAKNVPISTRGGTLKLDEVLRDDVVPRLAERRGLAESELSRLRGQDVYREMDEWFPNRTLITRALKRMGFDGITHPGGQIMGNRPHKVGIAWDPKQIIPSWLYRGD